MTRPDHVAGGQIIASVWGNNVVNSLPPIGTMVMIPADTVPVTPEWSDWLLCNGAAVNKLTYNVLSAMCAERFGATGDPATFRIPNMQGRYPIGRNPGGAYFAGATGTTGGSADATGLLPHQHTGVNHLHGYSGSTVGANARHIHQMPAIQIIQSTASPTFYVHVTGGGGFDIAATLFDLNNLATTGDYPDHGHAYSGATAGADRDLTTGVSGTTTANANLPPSLSVSFVIRAL